MADPGTEVVMRIGVHTSHSSADLFNPLQHFSARACKYFLSWSGRDKPYRALEQIRVCALDARLFLSGHGMSSEVTAANVFAECGRRAGKNFGLSASDIGQQSFRRKRRPQTPDQFDDRADRHRQQNHLAASYRSHWIGMARIN